MKILFLSHYFTPEVNAPAKRTFEHAKIFAEQGHDIIVITNFPNHPSGKIFDGYKNKWVDISSKDKIKIIRVYTFLTPNKAFIRRSLNFIIFMVLSIYQGFKIDKVDVILATSPQMLCGFAGMILSKIKKIRFVLEIRDIWPESISSVNLLSSKSPIYFFLKFLEKRMVKSADLTVTVTSGIQSYIKKMKHNKIKLITNGIMVSNYLKIKKKINKPLTFAYVGTIGLAHNIDIVIEAAEFYQNNNNIRFLIIGDGAEQKKIFNKAKNLNNVETSPLLFGEDLNKQLEKSDIGLVTLMNKALWKDALPSKIFEFLILEKPVILSMPHGKTSNMIEKNQCGLTSDPEDFNSFIHSINKYLLNPEIIHSHGVNGRNLVIKNFNREILAKELLLSIESLNN